jgi:cysteine-rich repeat protein
MMNRTTRHRPSVTWTTLLAVGSVLPACAIEYIDDLIDERGVTWCSETTQIVDTSTGSTGSSESSGTTIVDTTSTASTGTSDTSTSMGDSNGEDSSSSSGPGSFCGDGVVDADETCDDMNDVSDDGCNACARDSIVFVTSQVYQGNINGLDGADQRCRMLAAIAMLPRYETYRAWLSSSTTSAAERLIHSRGRYVLVNGLVVAQDWDTLVSGSIEHPINIDENSQTQSSRAWTGTLANGTAAPGAGFCADWTVVEPHQGGTGLVNMTDATWSFFENVPCSAELHLYCIEQ